MKWDSYTKNGVSKVLWSQNEAFFRNERLKFWPIFPYIFGEKRAPVRVGANFVYEPTFIGPINIADVVYGFCAGF